MSLKTKKLFVAITNDKIVCVSTNPTAFIRDFRKLEPGIKSDSYYEKRFKKEDIITFTNEESDKKYVLQKIVNPKLS